MGLTLTLDQYIYIGEKSLLTKQKLPTAILIWWYIDIDTYIERKVFQWKLYWIESLQDRGTCIGVVLVVVLVFLAGCWFARIAGTGFFYFSWYQLQKLINQWIFIINFSSNLKRQRDQLLWCQKCVFLISLVLGYMSEMCHYCILHNCIYMDLYDLIKFKGLNDLICD